MKLNRRNALIGLGALAVGGGAAFGSGAFSQVRAERTVSLNIAGDASALLQLEPGSGATGIVGTTDTNADSGNVNLIEFSQSNLNADAKTTFDNALKVTNNGQDAVDFYIDDSTTGIGDPTNAGTVLEFEDASTDNEITHTGGGNTIALSAGGSGEVDVIIDLTGSDDENDLPSSVTLVAE